MGALVLMFLLVASPDQKADQKAIDELHKRDIAATKAYDVEALTALWTDDFTALPPSTPPVIGKKANRELLLAGQEASKQVDIVDYQQKWEEIQIVGDYAYEWGVFNSVVKPKNPVDAAPMKSEFRVMRILKRQPNGTWLVHRSIWNTAPPPEPPRQGSPSGPMVIPPQKKP